MKDKRYVIAKNLITTGYVRSFSDLFEIIPKTVIVTDLGMNNRRFSRLITNVENFLLYDVFRMAALLEISEPEMVNLIYVQYRTDNQREAIV